MALQEFEGAMIIVSHDRHMLRSTTDSLLLVDNGVAEPFDGDLDEYQAWLAEVAKAKASNQPVSDSAGADAELGAGLSKKEQRQQQADKRKRLQPLKNKLNSYDKQMEKLQKNLAEIEEKLADSDSYEDENKDNLVAWIAKQGSLKQELDSIEEQWFELSEELESFED